MPVLNTVLRRRILLIYLTVCLIFYALATLASLDRNDAWGERIATSLVTIGLLAALRRPAVGWRYRVALFCGCTAPPIALISHTELAAQVWALIPLILIAVFVRSWHRTRTARMIAVALGLAADVGLVIAPVAAPPLWLLMFPVCIMGIAEVIGLLHSALLDVAHRDPLTAVWNRAGLYRELADLLPRARRRKDPLAVIVLDIDDFKSVNDRDGHAAGDTVLTELAARWTTQVPDSALVTRLGGDEFVIVITGYDESRARVLADTLSGDGPIRVSNGVAVGAAYDTAAFTGLLAAADRDLYLAKGNKPRPPADEAPAR
ncbi:diguanylate cyclase domain-containing protein [Mycolicibacterium sp. A43C]